MFRLLSAWQLMKYPKDYNADYVDWGLPQFAENPNRPHCLVV